MVRTGIMITTTTVVITENKKAQEYIFTASGNVHTLKCEFRMPSCKQRLQKLCAFRYGLHLYNFTYINKVLLLKL
jgi:hypothetical protein